MWRLIPPRITPKNGDAAMEWTAGTPVKFAVPEDDYEAVLVMHVLEDRGDRVLVQMQMGEFAPALQPQSVYLKTDLIPAE